MRLNIVSNDFSTDRIYVHSGKTSTVINSFSSPAADPKGMAFVNMRDLVIATTSGIIWHTSSFSSTILNSFTIPGTATTGLTFDGKDLISTDSGTKRVIKYSGVSQTVIDSFSSPSTNPTGLTWDGQNVIIGESNRIIQLSAFSNTVLNSFSSVSTNLKGLTFDGKNILSVDSGTARTYIHSAISGTITTSFSSVTSSPAGLAIEATISGHDCIELNNGDLLVVYNSGQGGATYSAASKRLDVSANLWKDEVTIDANNTGYTHPAVVQLASNAAIPNRIICAFRDKAAGTINIYKSDDKGATYGSLTTISSNLDENNRLSLVRSGSTLILSYHRGRVCYSRKSTNNGQTWSAENTIATSAVHCDLGVLESGAFFAVYEHYDIKGNSYGKIYSASSVNGTAWSLASSQVMTSTSVEYSRPTTVTDDTGNIYVVTQDASKDLRVVKGTNKTGDSWGAVELINPLPNQGTRITGTSNRGFFNPTMCECGGKLLTIFESWDGDDGHLTALKSQNWRNVTESVAYRDCYYPILGLPEIITSFILTNSAGTATESGGILTLTTTSSTDTRLYKKTINNVRTTSGVKIRFKTEIDAGGSTDTEACILRAQLSDGAKSINTTVRFSTTAVGFADGNKLDTWGSLTWTSRKWSEFSDTLAGTYTHGLTDNHEFLIAMKNSGVSIWHRDTHDGALTWVSAVEGLELNQSGVAPSSFIEYGIVNAVATMKVYSLEFSETEDGLYDGFTKPDDLTLRKTATGSKAQQLINGVDVTWGGSDGVVDDLWTITSAFTFPKEDMISDSPRDYVRTEEDNSEHIYIFDAGVNKVFNVDQFNLVGINFRTGKFQMNSADSWVSPALDQSFTLATEVSGTITGKTQNTITDSSLALRLNQLARPNRPKYLRITSGTADGFTYAIESNTSTLIKLTTATAETDGVAVSDTFEVFSDRVTTQVSTTNARYIRLVIDAQHTADDFYKIGKFIAGTRLTLSKNFNVGYEFKINSNINVDRSSRAGQKFSVKRGESSQVYELNFTHKTSAFTKEIEEFFEATDWSNHPFIFIKDNSDIQDFILARVASDYSKTHIISDIFNINGITVEEEI
mgnify:CR=1 FL=1